MLRIARRSGAPGCRSRKRPTSTSSSRCSAGSNAATLAPTNGVHSGWCAARTASGRRAMRRCCASRFPRASLARAARRARRASRSATRAASGTSRLGRTSSCTSSSCTTSSPRCARCADAGITTREACGNSVRNITGCPYAGVSRADEAFDVTPYAEALTRYLLRHPLSAVLPRKFKIAFEGCSEDHIVTVINDIGWTARVQTVGGRASRLQGASSPAAPRSMTRAGSRSTSSCRSKRCSNVAEAIIRVFHRLGDYKHKQQNRMKFLVKSLGWDGVRRPNSTASWPSSSEGAKAAAVRFRAPAGRGRPDLGASALRHRRGDCRARADGAPSKGPGIAPRVEPRLTGSRPT